MAFPSLMDEIDRLFDELVRQPWNMPPSRAAAALRPVEDGWIVEVPIDGLQAEDVEVELHGRQLTIRGARRTEHRRWHAGRLAARERSTVALLRTLTLPADVRPEDVEAQVRGTTLYVHVRKREPWRKLITPTKG